MQLHCQKEEVNTYRVGDDEDVSVRRSVSSGLGEVADDGSVGVEEVCQLVSFMPVKSQPEGGKHTVTGHAGLTRDTGGDEDDLRALEGVTEARVGGVVARDDAVGVDVAEISSNTYWNCILAGHSQPHSPCDR